MKISSVDIPGLYVLPGKLENEGGHCTVLEAMVCSKEGLHVRTKFLFLSI